VYDIQYFTHPRRGILHIPIAEGLAIRLSFCLRDPSGVRDSRRASCLVMQEATGAHLEEPELQDNHNNLNSVGHFLGHDGDGSAIKTQGVRTRGSSYMLRERSTPSYLHGECIAISFEQAKKYWVVIKLITIHSCQQLRAKKELKASVPAETRRMGRGSPTGRREAGAGKSLRALRYMERTPS